MPNIKNPNVSLAVLRTRQESPIPSILLVNASRVILIIVSSLHVDSSVAYFGKELS